MNISKKEKPTEDIKTLGFQILGFLLGVPIGAGVVILIINVVRILCETTNP